MSMILPWTKGAGSGEGEYYTMVSYKIVKYCSSCRKRFLVNNGESKRIYCDECERRFRDDGPASEE
ncbi:hypothetical protein ACFL3V_02945 [Nanoarchaeota archaeon]